MIHIYTGKGKGKTTAALGLALRAAGAGKRIFICQFLKGRYSCEVTSLKKLKNIKLERFGTGCFVKKSFGPKDIALARCGLQAAKKALRHKNCDMIILDEINSALGIGLLETKELIALVKKIPKKIEVILTGRNAPPELIKIADLVSDIKEVKHYFNKGVDARRGIEF